MKTIILFLSFFCGFALLSYSQQSLLILKNKETGKTILIPEGKKIKVIDSANKSHVGIFSIYTDTLSATSFLIVGKDTLGLNSILNIKTRSKNTQILGGTLAVGGGSLTILGIYIFANSVGISGGGDGMGEFFKVLFAIIGGGVAIVGGIGTLAGIALWSSFSKKYPSGKWEYQVKTLLLKSPNLISTDNPGTSFVQ